MKKNKRAYESFGLLKAFPSPEISGWYVYAGVEESQLEPKVVWGPSGKMDAFVAAEELLDCFGHPMELQIYAKEVKIKQAVKKKVSRRKSNGRKIGGRNK